MNKPTIAELIHAAGYTTFTNELVQRASSLLYGKIGAGQDERDWAFILNSSDPFAAAELGLKDQFGDQDFLLNNAMYLLDKGYSEAQIEWTYRQMQERIGQAYTSKEWALGTWFENTTLLSDAELQAKLRSESSPELPDTIKPIASNFTANSTTVGATSNEAGKLGLYDSGNIITGLEASFTSSALTQTITVSAQSAITNATLKVSDSAGNEADETKSIILGTALNDSITNTSNKDVIFGFAGTDTVSFDGGAGHYPSGADMIDGGADTDTLSIWNGIGGGNLTIQDSEFTNVSNFEELEVSAGGTATITLGSNANTAFSSGITVSNPVAGGVLNLDASGYSRAVTASGGSNADTITGGAGADTITGGAGADTITGGAGADIITGGDGSDTFFYDVNDVGSGQDALQDFTHGTDTIQISLTGAVIDASVFIADNGTGSLNWSQFKAGSVFVDQWTGFATEYLYVFAEDSSGSSDEAIVVNIGDNSGIQASDLSYMLNGTNGADQLTGGAGDDIITGGTGADSMTGGDGSDSFVVTHTANDATATEVIKDFVVADDSIKTGTAGTAYVNKEALDLSGSVSLAAAATAAIADATTGAALAAAGDVGTFTYNSKIYLVQNNAADATFDAGTDALVEITGYNGTITAADVIA